MGYTYPQLVFLSAGAAKTCLDRLCAQLGGLCCCYLGRCVFFPHYQESRAHPTTLLPLMWLPKSGHRAIFRVDRAVADNPVVQRVACQFALCLLFGSLLNIAIAWVCALSIAPPKSWKDLDDKATVFWQERGTRFTEPIVSVHAAASHTPGRLRFMAIANGPRDRSTIGSCFPSWPQEILFIDHTGWPFPSMEVVRSRFTGSVVVESGWQPPAWVTPTRSWSSSPLVPLRPVSIGFALNSAVYAAATWAVVFSFPIIRRVARIRRHCCPSCGYPFGASPVCTECGHALASNILGTVQAKCPKCNYDLSGRLSESVTCPECGASTMAVSS